MGLPRRLGIEFLQEWRKDHYEQRNARTRPRSEPLPSLPQNITQTGPSAACSPSQTLVSPGGVRAHPGQPADDT